MKYIKSCIAGLALLATFIPVTQASPNKSLLRSYYQLFEALQQGHNVNAIISTDKCKFLDGTSPNTGGSFTRMNFDIFNYYKPAGQSRYTIATAYTHFTEHGAYGPVMGYARLRVYDDNTAELHTSTYDPVTYQLKENSYDYVCKISTGDDANAIQLFDENKA